ncbi:Thiol-disulfide isomerase or thioredoxin [Parapedobacter luteus]|uniref:Thiol-disulfide isomerase or thioredoxin n=1 Tax=Parapedobacter luteus TaxID=623280 RepID=A0A1T5CSK9_9SPHI|nr:TlpA disulfide reductase family protein [Parapedobacter luteus]SKB62478.1 Thiol-disulfide isomerase or thioredoxin [Parapedobacter luteus]
MYLYRWRYIFLLVGLLLQVEPSRRLFAQQRLIGDSAPEHSLNNVVNYDGNSLQLSDFRGKVVLLDFWSIGCPSCIAAFPKLDSLQRRFDKELQIVLVTSNKLDAVKAYMKASKYKLPNLPLVTGDKILKEAFPYKMVPMQVWIDEKGKIRAITNPWYATEVVIEQMLAGNWPDMEVRRDNLQYDKSKLLGEQSLLDLADYASSFSRFVPEIPAHMILEKDSVRKVSKKAFYNKSILSLLQTAYSKRTFPNPSQYRNIERIRFEGVDTADWFDRKADEHYEEWRRRNLFSYELKIPLEKDSLWFDFMQADLNRFLALEYGVTAKLEEEEVIGMILVKLKEDIEKNNFDYAVRRRREVKGQPFRTYLNPEELTFFLEQNAGKNVFFLNDTGIRKYFPIVLKNDVSDLKHINEALAPYGLHLKKGKFKLERLVISKVVDH